jgi:hypothetical protein
VLSRISRLNRQEDVGCWGVLHNEGLRNLDALANINRIIKIRMRWAECSTYEEAINTYKISVRIPRRKRPLGNLGVNGVIILE